MESVAYELIKNEGIQQGINQGLQQGMLRDAQELLMDAVMERFGKVPPTLEKAILGISPRKRSLRVMGEKMFIKDFSETKFSSKNCRPGALAFWTLAFICLSSRQQATMMDINDQ